MHNFQTMEFENSPVDILPAHVAALLRKGGVEPKVQFLHPNDASLILKRHPTHRDPMASQISALVHHLHSHDFNSAVFVTAPFVAIRYSAATTAATRTSLGVTISVAAGSFLVVAGASRAEAFAHVAATRPPPQVKNINGGDPEGSPISPPPQSTVVQADASSSPPLSHEAQSLLDSGLPFLILSQPELLSPFELFLLSAALNAADPTSRAPSYFERTDQIAFVGSEIGRRKGAEADVCEIAIEIIFHPALADLKLHLCLPDIAAIPYPAKLKAALSNARLAASLPDPLSQHYQLIKQLGPTQVEELEQSRVLFGDCLPAEHGVIPSQLSPSSIHHLDVLIDLATSVNSSRLLPPQQARKSVQLHQTGPGLLHPRIEDQLRTLFCVAVAQNEASQFSSSSLRDLISVVLSAVQTCSRQFKSGRGPLKKMPAAEKRTAASSATSPVACMLWIDRAVAETQPQGLFHAIWSFPTATLVMIFYIYFVAGVTDFDSQFIQQNLLQTGTVWYRCVAEISIRVGLAGHSILAPVESPVDSAAMEAPSGLSLLQRAIPRSARSDFLGWTGKGPIPSPCIAPVRRRSTQISMMVLEAVSWIFRCCLFGSVTIPTGNDACEGAHEFRDADSLMDYIRTVALRDVIATEVPGLTVPTSGASSAVTSSGTLDRLWESRRAQLASFVNAVRKEAERDRPDESVLSPGVDVHKPSAEQPWEFQLLDPGVVPAAAPARNDFLALIHGVVSMMLDRHPKLLVGTGDAVTLLLPANMLVLAALKVALATLPPHFDAMAPTLLNWNAARVTLALWLCRSCEPEMQHQAAEKYNELWMKMKEAGETGNAKTPPTLRLAYVGPRVPRSKEDRPLDLQPAVMRRIMETVLPSCVDALREALIKGEGDDSVISEYFSNWLRPGAVLPDADLVAAVNRLFAAETGCTVVSGSGGGGVKRPREAQPKIKGDHQSAARQTKKNRVVPTSVAVAAAVEENEDLGEWLKTLSEAHRTRLMTQDCPSCIYRQYGLNNFDDLLRWRPPELSGLRQKGEGFRSGEWRRQRLLEAALIRGEKSSLEPLSEADWAVTQVALKLLRDRGIDTLVSRSRQHVHFLDAMGAGTKTTDDEGGAETRKARRGRVAVAAEVAETRRYGCAFTGGSTAAQRGGREQVDLRIADLEELKLFLEFSATSQALDGKSMV